MLIAGEASGDLLAAELVSALLAASKQSGDGRAPQFFGAGGPKMADAGVDLAFDLTEHSVVGFTDVVKNYFKFRRLFNQLFALAIERKPDAVVGVDFGGFNLRFGHAIRQYTRENPFSKWNPKIVQFVSPQVWASRPGRAKLLEADYDLLLSIFPFEKDWYAQRTPKLRVEFVGHPMVGRFATADRRWKMEDGVKNAPTILLLPGSRTSELKRHLPVMLDALELIQGKLPTSRARMVLPNPALKKLADKLSAPPPNVEIQVGNLPEFLATNGHRHRFDGHGDDGVRVLRRAGSDALPDVMVQFRNRQAHRHREMGDDAEHSGQRGGLSRIHPKRRHAGKHCRRRAGTVAERIAPAKNQIAARENRFLAG